MSAKTLFLLALVALLLFPLVSAVTLDSGTVLNTSVSNSSMTFPTVTVYVDQVTVTPTTILLYNSSFTNGNLIANISTTLNWSTVNRNLASNLIAYLSTDSASTKKITTSVTHSFNTTFTFTVESCNSVGNIRYVSNGAAVDRTFQKGSYTCSNNKVTLPSLLMEPGTSTITLDYSCSQETNIGFRLIMIFLAIGIFGVVAFIVYNNGIEVLNVQTLLVLFIFIVVGSVVYLTAGQNLGAVCPVS